MKKLSEQFVSTYGAGGLQDTRAIKIKVAPRKLSNVALADEIGELAAKARHIEKLLEAAKDEFKRRNISHLEGNLYEVDRVEASSTYLNKADVIAKLGEKWVDKHSTVKAYTKVLSKAKVAAILKAA